MIALLTLGAAIAADCTVISGTTAWTPDGAARGVSVVVEGDRVAAVGPRHGPNVGAALVVAHIQRVTRARFPNSATFSRPPFPWA